MPTKADFLAGGRGNAISTALQLDYFCFTRMTAIRLWRLNADSHRSTWFLTADMTCIMARDPREGADHFDVNSTVKVIRFAQTSGRSLGTSNQCSKPFAASVGHDIGMYMKPCSTSHGATFHPFRGAQHTETLIDQQTFKYE